MQARNNDVAVRRREGEGVAEAGDPVIGGELVVHVDVDGDGVIPVVPGRHDRLAQGLGAVLDAVLTLQAGPREQEPAAGLDR